MLGCTVLVYASLLIVAPNGASARDNVAITPLEVDGQLADTWRVRLSSRLSDGTKRTGRSVVSSDQPPRCSTETCWVELAHTVGARYLIRPRIRVEGRDFDVRLELLDGESGAVVSRSGEVCEVCAMTEVGDVLAAHAGVLSEKLDALVRAAPLVHFESTPTGAVVYLDGKPLGTTPLQREVTPGQHRARAELRGHVALERQLDTVAATEERVEFTLQRRPRVQRARFVGWALLGMGLPLSVTGITLIAIDERPYQTRCTDEYVDEDGNCRLRYDTVRGGIAVTAVGVASLIAGGVIIGLGRRPARDRSLRTSVSWNAEGVGISAHGRF